MIKVIRLFGLWRSSTRIYHLLFFLILIACLLVVSIRNAYWSHHQPSDTLKRKSTPPTVSMLIDQRDLDDARLKKLSHQRVLSEEFFNTTNLYCRPPNLSIDSKEMWQFVASVQGMKPNCSQTPNWIYVVDGRIHFNEDALRRHRSIQCNAQPIIRPVGEEFWVTLGDGLSFNQDQTPQVPSDLFVVDCWSDDGNSYKNYHLGIRWNQHLQRRHIDHPISENNLGYSILMFGFDSVSRLAFMRFLPKTYAYLINELGSIVMKGYNIVGDGTTPNMLALLSGHKLEELNEGRRGKDNFTDDMIHWFHRIQDECKYCLRYKHRQPFDLLTALMEPEEQLFVKVRKLPKCNRTIDLIGWINKHQKTHKSSRSALLTTLMNYKRNLFPDAIQHDNLKMIDDYPWIWKRFVEDGYITQWIEDWQGIGSLTWRLNGFFDPPVDYYGRPFYLWAESERSSDFDHCFGSITRFQSMLTWLNDLFLTYSLTEQRKFSFGFHKKYTHGSYDALAYADVELLHFLQMLNQRGEFDRTILIFITDHGPRFLQTAQTYQGRLEERLPFLSIRMPTDFQMNYPKLMHNLRLNSHRLTTPFDVHETLLHLFEFHSSSIYQSKHPRSRSLFQLIPHTRTCNDAGINPHLCACVNWRDISVNDPIIVQFSKAVIQFFNRFMSTHDHRSECAVLSLFQVQKARISIENQEWLKFDQMAQQKTLNETKIQTYQIQLETVPGHGQFELTAAYHLTTRTFDIQRQHLSRINRYGKASACIAEKRPEFRELCYCSNLLNQTVVNDHH